MRRRELFAVLASAAAIPFVHSGVPVAQLTDRSEMSWFSRCIAELGEHGYAEAHHAAVATGPR